MNLLTRSQAPRSGSDASSGRAWSSVDGAVLQFSRGTRSRSGERRGVRGGEEVGQDRGGHPCVRCGRLLDDSLRNRRRQLGADRRLRHDRAGCDRAMERQAFAVVRLARGIVRGVGGDIPCRGVRRRLVIRRMTGSVIPVGGRFRRDESAFGSCLRGLMIRAGPERRGIGHTEEEPEYRREKSGSPKAGATSMEGAQLMAPPQRENNRSW